MKQTKNKTQISPCSNGEEMLGNIKLIVDISVDFSSQLI